MRTSWLLLLSLIAIQALAWHHLYQGVCYFGLAALLLTLVPRLRFENKKIWLLAWLGVWVDSLGNQYDWYGRIQGYDHFSHGIVAVIVVFCFIAMTTRVLPSESSSSFRAVWGFLGSTMLMSLYEVWEYFAQRLFHIQFIWGMFDTTLDLGWNMVGALVGALLFYATERGKAR